MGVIHELDQWDIFSEGYKVSGLRTDIKGGPPNRLHDAARLGDIDSIRQILADPECVVDAIAVVKGWAALHFAAESGQLEACQVLLLHGADPNIRSGELIKDGDLRKDWYWEPGHTPIMLAARRAHFDVVELLIEMGADAHLEDTVSWTALHAACVCNEAQIVKLLVSKGADTGVSCSFRKFDEELGWHFMLTPLHVAAMNGSLEAAACLLEHGAAMTGCWTTKRTPLIYAAARGHAEMVELLCRYGADPNAREHSHSCGLFMDSAALHYAASNGHIDAVAALLKCGAEPRSRESHRGLTPLEIAEAAGHQEVASAIRQELSK